MYFSHLIDPGVEVHDEVLGLGVPVPDLALVTVRVPRHPLRTVPVLTKLETIKKCLKTPQEGFRDNDL